MLRAISLSLVLVLGSVTSLHASEGVLEINQACAVNTGCFSGDTVGLPVTITTPGSYRLTSNLTIPDENTHGIVVSTSSVSIDLNGFRIAGPVTCSGSPLTCLPASGTGSGVWVDRALSTRGTSVKNGSITGMGGDGVSLDEQAEVTNLRVRWNRISGISVNSSSTVSGNTAYQNGLWGIDAWRSVVSGNTASKNGNNGIRASSASTVSGNTAYWNEQTGIVAGIGSTVSGNTAISNAGNGIGAGDGATVSSNGAALNGADGISAGEGTTIIGNSSHRNGDATTPDLNDGISCTAGCIVRGNSVRSNTGYGLNLGSDSAYSDNVVTSNTTGTVTGGLNMGGNSCNGTPTCP